MTNGMEFTIKSDNIKEILNVKDEAVEKAMIECGLIIERYASELAPVDTGRLRNSIVYATSTQKGTGGGTPATTEDSALRATPEIGSVYVGTNVEYAPAQEFGSQGRTGHHYLKKSIQDHLSEYQKIIENSLKG